MEKIFRKKDLKFYLIVLLVGVPVGYFGRPIYEAHSFASIKGYLLFSLCTAIIVIIIFTAKMFLHEPKKETK